MKNSILDHIGILPMRITDWIAEHTIDLFFFLLMFAVICVFCYLLFVWFPQHREDQIQLCMRAFEYTHDQCEFIVRNRIPVR